VQSNSILGDALTDLTNRGEIVLDPFSDRIDLDRCPEYRAGCCGVEIDPLYIDVTYSSL